MKVDTRHTGHPLNDKRFNKALNDIIWREDFNADDMADYMRIKLSLDSDDYDSIYAKAVEDCRGKASAIKDFIRDTGLKRTF
jgi:hypothetical protein